MSEDYVVMNDTVQFPRQALPFSRKSEKWRRQCILWGDSRTSWQYSPVRKALRDKRINYDLVRGKLHMEDVALILNPSNISADYIPQNIQHFPIMNSKLEVLIGEELRRPFDWRAVVTNPNAISEIEESKKTELLQSLQQVIEDTALSQEDYDQKLEELDDYYSYSWQDIREKRVNEYLNHYVKEYNIPLIFNQGFQDALIVGEEIYECNIEGGEPIIRRINPERLSAYRTSHSNRIEDADVILIEEYWSPGRIIDTFYDQLTKRDIDYLENLPSYIGGGTNEIGYTDERRGFIRRDMLSDSVPTIASTQLFGDGADYDEYRLTPYDNDGNVRVMRMYWKSKRKILKVKQYDQETGEEGFNFYAENYVPNPDLGEKSEELWVNESWEGVLIGGNNHDFDEHSQDGTYGIFVNIRPRPVQYSRLMSPSKCHHGIVGTVYNLNDGKPFSMVDMMKPYNYMYDIIHNRLSDTLASAWGNIAEVDLALIPDTWSIDKWMYFAKVNHIAVRDSFNEGNHGASLGKLAGSMNNNTQRIIADASGNYIQQLMNLAEWTKNNIGEIVGISKQREGQIANRETVGGVERATLQSSYITEWYFAMHNDTKRRSLDCFVETTKIAARGKKIKFRYISSDSSLKMMEFDGDEYAENDYGVVIDNSSDIVSLDQKIESLAQAALQTQTASLSDIMRMWLSTNSLMDKIRILQNAERKKVEQAQRDQQMQLQSQQEAVQAQLQSKQMELESQIGMNREDNETKVLVAQIQADNKLNTAAMQASQADDGIAPMSEGERRKLDEQIREFDLKIQQDNKKLKLEAERNDIARISANRKPSSKK